MAIPGFIQGGCGVSCDLLGTTKNDTSPRPCGGCIVPLMIEDFSTSTRTGSDVGRGPIKVAERKAFVEWVTVPYDDREPKSLRQWAIQNGVAYATAKRWRHDTRVYEEAADRLGRHVDLDLIPGAIKALGQVASDPDNSRHVQAARVLIDYLKWHVERSSDDSTDISKLTDVELRDLMVEALDELDVRTPLPAT